MTDNEHAAIEREQPWSEYRTDGDGPWREREFATVEQAEAWVYEHLGVDVVDVSIVHVAEPIEPYRGIGW